MKSYKNKENNAYYAYVNTQPYEFMPKEKEFESPVLIVLYTILNPSVI